MRVKMFSDCSENQPKVVMLFPYKDALCAKTIFRKRGGKKSAPLPTGILLSQGKNAINSSHGTF